LRFPFSHGKLSLAKFLSPHWRSGLVVGLSTQNSASGF
jgi:hypothetical protein